MEGERGRVDMHALCVVVQLDHFKFASYGPA